VVWVTRHGPVIAADGNERFALRWVAAEASGFQYPFIEINRARNWTEFTAALRRLPGPGSNFVYADTGGNIGYHAAGRLPIRKSYRGDLPVDGASGGFEWQGFIPFDELPSAFNPPGGVIVSANQNPFPLDYPYPVHGNFAPPYRSSQIHRLLTGRRGWGAGEMPAIQKDVYSAFGQFLAGELAAASDRRKVTNPALVEAAQLLRGWNGQMEKDLPQPMVVTLAFQHLRKAIAERASPGKGALYELQMAVAVIERLLRTRPPGWFADYDEAVVRSFADAVDEGQRMQGRSVKKWVYGKYHELTIAHPVGHSLPFVAKYFDAGPAPMSGSSTTVKQTTRRLGPSMRFVGDLGDWEKSMLSVPIGQSGHVLSKNYKDEWETYYSGGSYPMPFANPKAPDVLNLAPR
ncbi:MAG: penicillin acylase family protein, partial [Bryobacteraceae bacterium]